MACYLVEVMVVFGEEVGVVLKGEDLALNGLVVAVVLVLTLEWDNRRMEVVGDNAILAHLVEVEGFHIDAMVVVVVVVMVMVECKVDDLVLGLQLVVVVVVVAVMCNSSDEEVVVVVVKCDHSYDLVVVDFDHSHDLVVEVVVEFDRSHGLVVVEVEVEVMCDRSHGLVVELQLNAEEVEVEANV